MPSKKLESFSKRNPELEPLIQKLADYMRWLSDQGIGELIPRVAAAQLGISEADTLGLLSVFQDAGLMKPQYQLVCIRTKSVLGTYASLGEVPDEAPCEHCDRDHDSDDLRIELVFAIKGLASNAAA